MVASLIRQLIQSHALTRLVLGSLFRIQAFMMRFARISPLLLASLVLAAGGSAFAAPGGRRELHCGGGHCSKPEPPPPPPPHPKMEWDLKSFCDMYPMHPHCPKPEEWKHPHADLIEKKLEHMQKAVEMMEGKKK
ncbi:hypothetical protein FOA52_011669 [Chlamydomonas sp. UWO 241]|nr:hypothetical protein FOA52_011669 [Chlamydomonas sp. UWO 241]